MLIELAGQHPTSLSNQIRRTFALLDWISSNFVRVSSHQTQAASHIDNTTHTHIQYCVCVARKLAWFRSLLSRANIINWSPGSLPLHFVCHQNSLLLQSTSERIHHIRYLQLDLTLFTIASRLMCLRRNIHFPTKRHKINDINRIWFHLDGAHQGGNV